MREKLDEQTTQLEKYTSLKVNKIEIFSEQKFLLVNSTIKLSTIVKPSLAFNDGVEWQIIQEVEGSVEVELMNEKTLILRGLKQANKVTVIAKALDGSGVTESREILFGYLKGTIEVNVQQNQTIKGTIKVEEFGGDKLDKSRSKYILNTNSSPVLGENAYESGDKLDKSVKEVFFSKPKGEYYLHVLIVNSTGYSQELISQLLATTGVEIVQHKFEYKGSVESVELEPGRYKLEAWGAQGGSFDSTNHGGYGGYSTGLINLLSKTTLYVVVGKSTDSTSGGYNGGGCGGTYKNNYTFTSYGGGGASHIGLKPGELTAFSNDYSDNLLIVASGGGGATGTDDQVNKFYNSIGGCGGGCNGAVGKCKEFVRAATGATQSSGGKCGSYGGWNEFGMFGQGGNCGNHPRSHLGGGGGSGFYGGGSGGNSGPGGGGSGYINTSKLEEASMYGFEVPHGSLTFPATNFSSDAISTNAKQGDGYVIITSVYN